MEESLVEECTPFKLVPLLETVAKSMKSNATHHDHLVGLMTVIMSEAGFRIVNKNQSSKTEEPKTLDPEEWKSSEDMNYRMKFKHKSGTEFLDCKIIAIPNGDVLIINLCPLGGCFNDDLARTRSIAVQTFKYINPYSSYLAGRFMNLKEFSHRFKDNLTTPFKGEILTNAGITNASLSGLPTELKLRILKFLGVQEIGRISQCCREFRDLCYKRRV